MKISDYLNTMVTHYLICALWSSTVDEHFLSEWQDYTGEEPCPDDTALDSFGFTLSDIVPSARDVATQECRDFLVGSYSLIARSGLDPEQVGHDFWLTRNGHGAGFWDRGLGEVGDLLTRDCKPYGEAYCYAVMKDGEAVVIHES